MATEQDQGYFYPSKKDRSFLKRKWYAIAHGLQRNSFTPRFLPPQLQHPVAGYVSVVLLQIAILGARFWLARLFPPTHLVEILQILIVVLVSLTWGMAPGILATVLGTGLFLYLIAPTSLLFDAIHVQDVFEVCLYTIAGLTVSLLASLTQRARNEAEYAQQQATARANELEATFEAMTDGVIVYDDQGRMVHINSAYRELIELDKFPSHAMLSPQERGEMLALRDEHGHTLSSAQQPVQRMLTGERFSGERAMDIQMRTLDGREVQLNLTGTPLYNQQHQLTGGVLIFRDVTQRRQLEKRTHDALATLLAMTDVLVHTSEHPTTGPLSTSQQMAQRLVELACVLLGCQTGSIVTVAPDTLALHPIALVGLSAEMEQYMRQQIGQVHLYDHFSPTEMQQIFEGKPILTTVHRTATDDEPQTIRRVLGAPMRIDEQLVGFLSLDYDSGEHRYPLEQEMDLIAAIGKLAAVVMEREQLLKERTAAQAAELAAREANHLKDEFIGIAGHELRTPLTTIKVSIQLAQRQLQRVLQQKNTLAPEALKLLLTVTNFLERTERQVELQNRLVNDLLDVSRVETGHMELHTEPYDVSKIVREVVEDQQSLTPERTILLSTHMQKDTSVMIDTDRVRQVISNYLSNALKYSEASKPVEVSIERTGSSIKIGVRDEGPGLSAEEQQRIWERFYRVPGIQVKSGSGVGLGLGLHISRVIIEYQGGTVGVQSKPGHGSTFWFTLPLIQSRDTNLHVAEINS
jgi:signal transduction histidine kinase/PAS domain-containing protein